MVDGFEEYTHELTDRELFYSKLIVQFFSFKGSKEKKPYLGRENAIKAKDLIARFDSAVIANTNGLADKMKNAPGRPVKLTPARLGKIVHHIRASQQLYIVGTSDGYYLAATKEEMDIELKSMYQRVMGLLEAIHGLEAMKPNPEIKWNYHQKIHKFLTGQLKFDYEK